MKTKEELQSINDYLDEIIQEIVNSPSKTQYEHFVDKENFNVAEMLHAHISGGATRQNEIIDILLKYKEDKQGSNRIERMKTEKADLEARIKRLLSFMESDKFAQLDDIDKRLLRMQYAGMETYLTSLAARSLQEDIKRYEGDVKKLNEEFDALKTQGLSKEEVEQIMCDKVSKIQRIGDGMMDDLKSIVMSGMMFGEMQKSQSNSDS